MKRKRPNIEQNAPIFEEELAGLDEIEEIRKEEMAIYEKPKAVSDENHQDAPSIDRAEMKNHPTSVTVSGRVEKRLSAEALDAITLQKAGEIIETLLDDGSLYLSDEGPQPPRNGTGRLHADLKQDSFALVERLTGQIHVIHGSVKVGRNPNHAELVPEGNNTVSTEHAMLTEKEGTLLIRDLESTNGTFINGTRIMANQNIELSAGDTVTFSNAEYIVKQM